MYRKPLKMAENNEQKPGRRSRGRRETSAHLTQQPLLSLLQFQLGSTALITDSISVLTIVRLTTTLFPLLLLLRYVGGRRRLAGNWCRFSRWVWWLGNSHWTLAVPLSQVELARKLHNHTPNKHTQVHTGLTTVDLECHHRTGHRNMAMWALRDLPLAASKMMCRL